MAAASQRGGPLADPPLDPVPNASWPMPISWSRPPGVPVALVQASGEAVPLTDTRMDMVVCDYGAITFADPFGTVPEVAQLLGPGGLFAFNTSSPLVELCWPDDAEGAGDRLVRDYFGLHRLPADNGMVSFQLPYGE